MIQESLNSAAIFPAALDGNSQDDGSACLGGALLHRDGDNDEFRGEGVIRLTDDTPRASAPR